MEKRRWELMQTSADAGPWKLTELAYQGKRPLLERGTRRSTEDGSCKELLAHSLSLSFSGPPYLLNAPWTPFRDTASREVNLDVIAAQVAFAKSQGVTHIWISGLMSQFDQLTMEERKGIALTYIPLIRKAGIYSILHVGHQTLKVSFIEANPTCFSFLTVSL